MSEFSDCYYLFNTTTENAVSLVKRTHRYGLVLPQVGRYIPFLVEGSWDVGRSVDVVIEHNLGTLLHYSSAEDHGLSLIVYDHSQESLVIEIQRRGPSENVLDVILSQLESLDIVTGHQIGELRALLEETAQEGVVELRSIRNRLSQTLGIEFLNWCGCADLSTQSQKQLSQRFPDAIFVRKSRRGKTNKDVKLTPNQWCPQPGLPAFMYLPVPDGRIDEALLERHIQHWQETRDWDDKKQVGFWVYTGYCRALPSRFRYLANRILNLELAFGSENYEAALRVSVRGLLAVTDPTFEWEPYLNKQAGEQRL